MKLITLIFTGKKRVYVRNIDNIINVTFIMLQSGFDFRMRFFRDPESRSRGFGIGIFYFGLDRKIPKIPKSRGSGSGFENPEKIPKEKSRKSQNPGDRDRDFKTSKKSRKNPESKIPKIPKSRGSG